MNKVILVGRLGKDVEVNELPSGMTVANFTLATNEVFGSGDKKREETAWHNIVLFGKTAEIAGKYLSKGDQTLIEGRIKYESYERDGVTKYVTKIIGNKLEFIGGKSSSSGSNNNNNTYQYEDDVPF